MKKQKFNQIDLLYTKPSETKGKTKKAEKPNKTKSKKKNSSNKINLNNEVVIGLTPKKKENNEKKVKKNKEVVPSGKKVRSANSSAKEETKKRDNRKRDNAKDLKNKNRNTSAKKTKTRKNNEQIEKKKKEKIIRILKIVSIALIIIIVIILIMLSSIFNINNIKVSNNNKISEEEIITTSGLSIGKNMFMTSMWRAEENLKQNPYIGEAKIRRNINGTITINIIERIPAYVLRTQERYAYISNQGYILEIDGLPLELPVITGIKTEESGLEPGARLIREDLLKLEGLNIIMEAAKSYNLYNIINEIDISDHTEYTLSLETEGKIVHFGSSSRINQKMLWIVQIIEEEAGLSGEIFIRNLDFRRKSYV